MDLLGDFLAIMWECWNAPNRFIFGAPDKNLLILGKRAKAFVHSCRLHRETCSTASNDSPHPSAWTSPTPGFVKLNFDGGILGEAYSEWGFVLGDHEGNVLLARVEHHYGHVDSSTEEARACLCGLQYVHTYSIRNIIIKGGRLWQTDVPEAIISRATDDMYRYPNGTLI
ncbi:hypothetical protein Cgig2_015550 [Carnegiea gigantea]|uniref:RNase H type-1 domain-containing protein n=1 Tax=Carnegiea gigantea TaxID=171969 RepID=A0A9Q1GNV9_9CARY|nr:hypothetical protein Cgig2_015550 [Carnegiea gigantea]